MNDNVNMTINKHLASIYIQLDLDLLHTQKICAE